MKLEKINGIHCDVDNCVYNREGKECVAGQIDVSCSCSKPDCCDETICGTFKPKN